jgi:hypothetical protein
VAKAVRRPQKTSPSRAEPPGIDLLAEVEALGTDLSALLDPTAVMRAVSNRLVEHHGIPISAIWRMDDYQSVLELAATCGDRELPPNLERLTTGKTLSAPPSTSCRR